MEWPRAARQAYVAVLRRSVDRDMKVTRRRDVIKLEPKKKKRQKR